ncbi:CAP and S-layer homology domain-containing protein [Ureibacillus acetophenoni]|uniref:S-layer family protein n=1 Tax=Ureibacillus acetophenoni TaxID=614649 RepID=A0A285TYY6_9BACL|nr:S-layer homology domain-containing protein [Ureibacillus acetophenoni]SOC34894.1 S-layer family protein [Ureibacillus acetophenoni]
MKKIGSSLFVVLFFVFQLCMINASAETKNDLCKQTNTSNEFELINDISLHFWGTNPILNVVNQGYMEVYEDGEFLPNEIITRGEAAKVITKVLGVSLDSEFQLIAEDVSTSHCYFNEIRKLAELGIIQNDDLIRPDEPLTRAEVAVLISRAFQVEVDQQNKSTFKDYKDSFWAKHTIESLADVDIIQGTSATTYSPNDHVTRAQLATFISRAQEFSHKVNHLEITYDYLSKEYISTKNEFINWADEVVHYVNIEREKFGVAPLELDMLLNQLAIIKAKDMVKRHYFEHKSPYYGYPWDLATLFDYEYTSLGENIARNFQAPKDVVDAWMESPSHRENMLRDSYTNIGVGITKDDNGNYYWVQMFSST